MKEITNFRRSVKALGLFLLASLAIVIATNGVSYSIGLLPSSEWLFSIIAAVSETFTVRSVIATIASGALCCFLAFMACCMPQETMFRHQAAPSKARAFLAAAVRVVFKIIAVGLKIMAVGLLVCVLVTGIFGLVLLLKWVVSCQIFVRYNFALCMGGVLVVLQFSLRKRILTNQTWKTLTDIWLKFAGVATLSVGGFGVIGLRPEMKTKFLQAILHSEYVNVRLMVSCYILTVVILGLSHLFVLLGKAATKDEDSNAPLAWFVPAFGTAWIANAGMYALFFHSILLTLHAHLMS